MCYFCHHVFVKKPEIFRSSTCPQCQHDLKVCRNCRFYDTDSHWECRETIPERVADKERANFCDYFSFQMTLQRTAGSAQPEKATQAWNDLFKD